MSLPDFIIGGAPKCGTTALFEYLDQHPQVFTSTPKEPHFFASEGGEKKVRGMSFTRKKYENIFENNGDKIAGEASTGYLYHAEKSAPQIAELIPEVRLIFLLRNPVKRDYSEYWFRVHTGDLPLGKPFSDYVSNSDHWIFSGSKSYLPGLRTFYSHFREEQILVLLTDDLRQSSKEVLCRICNHIGVDPGFDFDISARHNVTKHPRSVRLCRWIGRIAPGFSQWVSKASWLRGLRSFLLFSSSAVRPPMLEGDRKRLIDRYKAELERLERLIKRDLSHWREP
jgi:hypothetical protein